MKKTTLLVLLLSTFSILFAQAPQKMSYQSVIRKTDGALVVNTVVGMKISILQGSENGTAMYVETQTMTTNANGLATLAIGGGTPVTGTFAGINWGTGTYFIKTETDPTGGTSYTISGTSQLLSVPYALYAGSSQSKGKTSILLTGKISDAQAAAQIAAESGPYTENVYIQDTNGLTTVDLSPITNLVNLVITKNSNLTTINLTGLAYIFDSFLIEGNNALSTLSVPVLKSVTSGGDSDFSISNNPSLTSISFPSLINTAGSFDIKYNTTLISASFPVLKTASSIGINDNALITSISFPILSMSEELTIRDNLSLTSIGLPMLSNCKSISFGGNSFPSSQINTLLNKLLTVTPSSGKYISLDGQKPPAPPTGQGITDKATLINAENTVSTD